MLFTVSDVSEIDCIIKALLSRWDCDMVIVACEYVAVVVITGDLSRYVYICL